MEIKTYNIPKLPRNKYISNTYINGSGGSGGSGGTTINNYNAKFYDGLGSSSIDIGLTAHMGKVLNENKLDKGHDDTAQGVITFNAGLKAYNDVKAGGFNDDGNVGIGAAMYKNNNDWNIIGDNISSRKNTSIGQDLTVNNNAQIKKDLTVNNNATFENDMSIGGNTTVGGSISSNDYGTNNGFSIYQNNAGKWCFSIDDAKIRGKLDINTLIVNEAKHIAGNIYCTKAGMKCNKVIAMINAQGQKSYTCCFNNIDSDGLKIYNQFQVGDLAFCQTFNNNKVRKWWRMVTAVGENSITVNDTNCMPDSSEPEPGDNIVLLGNRTNVERQGAVIIWTDAICVYKGIEDYELPEPIIKLDPNDSKIDADTINFIGKTIINNNFTVDENGNLKIKGDITTDSGSIGNFTINQYGLYNDIKDGAATIEIYNSNDQYVGFRIGTPQNVGFLDVFNRAGDVINVDSEYGTAIRAISANGWGIESSRTKINGLHLNVTKADNFTNYYSITDSEDIVIFYKPTITMAYLPAKSESSAADALIGKVIILKSMISNNVQILGDIVPKGSNTAVEYINLPKWQTMKLVCDGDVWYQID